MKRFLSLVLTLVMVMSLVTVSAGAKEFTDDENITYDEAVDVISTIGVVDGDTNGSFRPTDTLTRQAAAKIICNLILGPTTAAELHADTAPYKDVAVNNQFAGYIAYCQSRGIISGYADGSFRPTGTLTGYAFMKMLLGALGYDSSLEGYVGSNWSINVAKQALGIGLNKGLVDEFNGIKAVTREEACLYAFRTIQSDLVEYGQRLTTNVNGTEVTLSAGGAKSRYWTSQQSRHDYIREDNIIQFAEEYFNKLEKRKGRDDFERPAYTWIYDKEEIGTYVDWELLVERYTTGVSGRDLYDLLGATALKENDFVYYVNGVVPSDTHPMNAPGFASLPVSSKSNIVVAKDLVRSNKDDVGITERGVLTEVFLDKDAKVITITSIDTFLAKALSDYNESKEYAPLEVYTGLTGTKDAKKTIKTTWNVDKEDVAEIVDVKEDDYKLVNITFKNDTKGEVVIISDPEIMEESTVTKFTKDTVNVAEKVTVSGTEYKNARRAFFSDDALNWYDETLLTDKTYNVYMDPYGYFIGLELYEGAKNYVFITGFDRPTSNLAISTAKANGIFLDGTMQNITVNVKSTNNNIKTANTKGEAARTDSDPDTDFDSYQYFAVWDEPDLPGKDGSYRYNRWFTYSVTADGVYTLKPCVRMTATKYTKEDTVIRTDNLYVDDNVYVKDAHPYNMDGGSVASPKGIAPRNPADDGKNLDVYKATKNERSYGNDDTVFITVGLDDVDTVNGPRAITEVEGTYTGVQNVEIEIDNVTDMEEAQIYTAYDSEHYMIGAVVVGEAKGANANIAYVVSAAKSERLEDGIYYWEFDAILDGTKQTLTAKSKYDMFDANTKATIDAESAGKNMVTGAASNLTDGLVELRMDADDYVVDVKQIDEKDIYNFYGRRYDSTTTEALKGANSLTGAAVKPTTKGGARPDVKPAQGQELDLRDAKAYRMNVIRGGWALNSVGHYADSIPSELSLKGRTLYITEGQTDEGLALASDCKAVVIQKENNKNNVLTEWPNVETALSHIADHNPNTTKLEFVGEVIAVMNDRGAAAWVVFKTEDELHAGSGAGTVKTDIGKYFKATTTLYSTGYAVVNVDVTRPEFIDPADGAGSDKMNFSFDIYVNGKPYQSVNSATYGGAEMYAIPDGDKTVTLPWSNVTTYMFAPLQETDVITVENFKFDYSDQTYFVEYVDQGGNVLYRGGDKTPMKTTDLASATATIDATGGGLDFKIGLTNYTTATTGKYSVLNAYSDATKATSTKGLITDVATAAPDTSTTTAADFMPGTYDAATTTRTYLEDYVRVEIDLRGLTLDTTLNVVLGDGLSATEKAEIATAPAGTATMADFGLTGFTHDKLKITLSKIATLNPGETVKVEPVVTGTTDANAYKVVVKTTAGNLTFEGIKDSDTPAQYLTVGGEDITITDVEVSVAIPKLKIDSVTVSGNTMTIEFNFGVQDETGAVLALADFVAGTAPGGTDKKAKLVAVDHVLNSQTVILTFDGNLVADDAIDLDASKATNSKATSDKLGTQKIKVNADVKTATVS